MLKEPRQLLHSGVRAVDAITASAMNDNLADLYAGAVRDRSGWFDLQLEWRVRADVRLADRRSGRRAGEPARPGPQPRTLRSRAAGARADRTRDRQARDHRAAPRRERVHDRAHAVGAQARRTHVGGRVRARDDAAAARG